MNAGMWKAYTTMYSALAARLPSRNGSQECPMATSTIARYLALSKKASRCPDRCAGAAASDAFFRPRPPSAGATARMRRVSSLITPPAHGGGNRNGCGRVLPE